MAVETKNVDNVTSTVLTNGSNVKIRTFYHDPALADVITAYITGEPQVNNSISFVENELGIDSVNYPNISFSIGRLGNLIIRGPVSEIVKYSINDDGDLIYTN